MIKVIAFDLFGTVFDMSKVPSKDIGAYIKHIKKPEWSPLILPPIWNDLPAFGDSEEGIDWLRENYTVVTCTNAPLGTQIKLCKNNRVSFDGYIPLELNKTFKTNSKAYMSVCDILNIKPEEMMMVTANEAFGDLEAATELGMKSCFIRHNSKVENIMHLGELMRYPEELDLSKILY